jgi:phage terminase small subunit
MGPLSNPKQEKFAQGLAKGKSQAEAYALAGYAPSDAHAARLAGNGRVAERVTELQEKAAEKVVFTIADMAAQLDEDRKFARDCATPAAAVSASMGKAKVLGFLTDKVDLMSSDGSMSPPSLAEFYGALAKGNGS